MIEITLIIIKNAKTRFENLSGSGILMVLHFRTALDIFKIP